jgi:ABC-2 type transport system permease protein
LRRLLALFRAKLRMGIHEIAGVRKQSKLKVGVVAVFVLALWLGIFFLFYEGFGYMKRFNPGGFGPELQTVGETVTVRIISLLFLAVFFMLTFSNVLVALTTLYRSSEVEFLLSSPLRLSELFAARFAECVFFSSWAILFLGSPLVLSYGLVYDAPWYFYPVAAAFSLPFVMIPAAVGVTITMILARVFPHLNRPLLIMLAAAAVTGLFLYMRRSFDVESLSSADQMLGAVLGAMKNTQSAFLPSFWAAQGVLSSAVGELRSSAFHFLLLLANSLLVFRLALFVASTTYYPGWAALRGSGQTRSRTRDKGILGRIDSWFRFLRPRTRSLIAKDIRMFWRDVSQWSQFAFFFGLMAVYVANLRAAGYYYLEIPIWKNAVSFLNLGATSLILATLTSRFIFPLISLEGKRFWVIGLAPVRLRELVWQKFWLSFATCITFTLGIMVISNFMLKVEPLLMFLSCGTIVMMNFSLSGLAVGLGALYPNFREDNPAKIVSGLGGTLNFLLSIAYIIVAVGVQAILFQARTLNLIPSDQRFAGMVAGVTAFVVLLSVMATFIPMSLGLKNLERTEF